MKITILVEGQTEVAFKPILDVYLKNHLGRNKPKLDFLSFNGRIPKEDKLKRIVEILLSGKDPSDHVIALTDVYTGTKDFADAADAINKMRDWVGDGARFTPHVALHDFEAWLLPYWPDIQKLAGHNRTAPAANPETVNHNNPPAYRLKEIFDAGNRRHYKKVRDAARILRGKDLGVAISKCAELKAFVNTIIRLSGGTEIV